MYVEAEHFHYYLRACIAHKFQERYAVDHSHMIQRTISSFFCLVTFLWLESLFSSSWIWFRHSDPFWHDYTHAAYYTHATYFRVHKIQSGRGHYDGKRCNIFNIKDHTAWTSGSWSINDGHKAIVQFLVNVGETSDSRSDTNARDCRVGKKKEEASDWNLAMSKPLIAHGLDVNARSRRHSRMPLCIKQQ